MMGLPPPLLQAPRLADWGHPVTVCIAALCNGPDGEEAIVAVTDRKVSVGRSTSADTAVDKDEIIASNWYALLAGSDMGHVDPVLDRTRELLGFTTFKSKRRYTSRRVASALQQAYTEQVHREIEAKVLRKLGMDVKSFRDFGKERLSDSAYSTVIQRIDKVNIRLSFLGCGFNPQGRAQLFTVDEDGWQRCDRWGFWSIGDGAALALSSLSYAADQLGFSKYVSIQNCVYHVLAAKFMAESAPTVGTRTAAMVFANNGFGGIMEGRIDEIRSRWKTEGAPREASLETLREIEGMIETRGFAPTPLISQTSEDQR